MAVNKVYKFRRIEEVTHFLNGGVVGGSVNKAQGGGTPANLGAGINGLVGATLKLKSPAIVTVTFARADGAGGSAAAPGTNPDPFTLLFKDIKAQIEAAAAGVLVVLLPEQTLGIIEKTPTSGVKIDKTGTANQLLGFDAENDSTGKVYSPAVISGGPPSWTWAYSGNDNMHNIYTWE